MRAYLLTSLLLLVTAAAANEHADSNEPLQKVEELVPRNMTIVGDREYYINTELRVNMIEATDLCNALGLRLVSFQTVRKFEQLRDYLLESGQGNLAFWSSGQLLLGRWLWTGRGQLFSEFSWGVGQPNETGGEVCVWFDANWGWWDIDCASLRNFVCE